MPNDNQENPAGPQTGRPYMPGYGIRADAHGLLPWSWAVERLEKAHNYFVATTRPDGAPHVMPVWGVWLNDKFYFGTAPSTRKARNLAANPRCVVCPENAAEAVIVEGVAELTHDRAVIREVLSLYNPKYSWNAKEDEGPLWVVRPRTVFAFIEDHEDFIGTATRWIFDD